MISKEALPWRGTGESGQRRGWSRVRANRMWAVDEDKRGAKAFAGERDVFNGIKGGHFWPSVHCLIDNKVVAVLLVVS